MKLADLQKEAAALPKQERITLVCSLLDTLPAVDFDVTDEEVLQRDRDLESGNAEPMSHEEFVAAVERERNR